MRAPMPAGTGSVAAMVAGTAAVAMAAAAMEVVTEVGEMAAEVTEAAMAAAMVEAMVVVMVVVMVEVTVVAAVEAMAAEMAAVTAAAEMVEATVARRSLHLRSISPHAPRQSSHMSNSRCRHQQPLLVARASTQKAHKCTASLVTEQGRRTGHLSTTTNQYCSRYRW